MSVKQPTALHMLMAEGGKMIMASTSMDDLIKRQTQNPGSTPYLNVDPLVVAQFIDGRAPYKLISDDAAWGLVGPALRVFHDHISVYEADGLTPHHRITPTDTPLAIAVNRLELLERYPRIVDLPTAVELSEVVLADRYDRQPNKAMFRPESIGRCWGELAGVGKDHLRQLIKGYKHELVGLGSESGVRNEAIDYLKLSIDELSYVANDLTDNEAPAHAPGM